MDFDAQEYSKPLRNFPFSGSDDRRAARRGVCVGDRQIEEFHKRARGFHFQWLWREGDIIDVLICDSVMNGVGWCWSGTVST